MTSTEALFRDLENFVDKHFLDEDQWLRGLVSRKYDYEENLNHPTRLSQQKHLQEAASTSSTQLADFIRKGIGINDDDLNSMFPSLQFSISESELLTPQAITMQSLHSSFSFSRRLASSGFTWRLATIFCLETGVFPDPPVVAFQGKPGEVANSLLLFQEADLSQDDYGKVDFATRPLLRKTGGLPHVRDRSAFMYDCPLASAWWRAELASAVAIKTEGAVGEEDVLRVLHSRQRWERWTRQVIRRSARLSPPNALAGFVLAVFEKREQDGGADTPSDQLDSIPTTAEVTEMMAMMSRRCRGKNVAGISPAELAQMCVA